MKFQFMVCFAVSKALSASRRLVSIFRNKPEPEPEIHNSLSAFKVTFLTDIFEANDILLFICQVTLVDQR